MSIVLSNQMAFGLPGRQPEEGISYFLPVLHLELSTHSKKWSVIPHIVCELFIAASC